MVSDSSLVLPEFELQIDSESLIIFVFQNLCVMLAGPTLLLTSDIIKERLGASALDM